MDKHGFLPPHPCKRCGNPLQGMGDGRPAELYLGTYTGLCYTCERGPAYRANIYPLDGAESWSYPPSCPSWRRDRVSYIAYPDCPDCKNHPGIQGYSHGQYGSYREYCRACVTRFSQHPARLRYRARITWIRDAAEATYTGQLIAWCKEQGIKVPKRPKGGLGIWLHEQITEDISKPIAREIIARHDRILATWNARNPDIKL